MTDSEAFERYLAAKRTVDDRAIDRRVRDRLGREVSGTDPLRVLEVGAGIGSNVERFAAWDTLPDRVLYTAVDVDPGLVRTARDRLPGQVAALGYAVEEHEDGVELRREDRQIDVEFIAEDAFAFIEGTGRAWDLVVGHAVFDLADVGTAVEAVSKALGSGGLLYCPVTYDGLTTFEPPIDPAFDRLVEHRYHRHMDHKETAFGGGDSRAGRHLLSAIPAAGGQVLEASASDWVLLPEDGGYHTDEAHVLRHVLATIEGALVGDYKIDPDRLAGWIARRRRQVEAGELVYIAHNLDVLGRFP